MSKIVNSLRYTPESGKLDITPSSIGCNGKVVPISGGGGGTPTYITGDDNILVNQSGYNAELSLSSFLSGITRINGENTNQRVILNNTDGIWLQYVNSTSGSIDNIQLDSAGISIDVNGGEDIDGSISISSGGTEIWNKNAWISVSSDGNCYANGAKIDSPTNLLYDGSTLTLTTAQSSYSVNISSGSSNSFDDYVGFLSDGGGTVVVKNNHTSDICFWGYVSGTSIMSSKGGLYIEAMNCTVWALNQQVQFDTTKPMILSRNFTQSDDWTQVVKYINGENGNTINSLSSTNSGLTIVIDEDAANLTVNASIPTINNQTIDGNHQCIICSISNTQWVSLVQDTSDYNNTILQTSNGLGDIWSTVLANKDYVNYAISSYVASHHNNYYSHNLHLIDATTSLEADVRIQNSTSSVATYQNIVNFLLNNGFVNDSTTFLCSGTVINSGNSVSLIGVYAISNQIMFVGDDFNSYPATTLGGDKVIHLGGDWS